MVMPAEPALIECVVPAVPAVDTAPTQATPERKAAAIPAGTVPAIEVEAIAIALMHINPHSDLINEIAAGSNQTGIDGKCSCTRVRCNQKRADRKGQPKCPH